jgi:hypothetical protein
MAQTTVDKFVQAVKEDLSMIAKLKAAVDTNLAIESPKNMAILLPLKNFTQS